jgi:outer membrane protein TolC
MVGLHVSGQAPASRNKTVNPPVNSANRGNTVNPLPTNPRNSDLPDTAIENRLVALALQGPEFDASIHQNKISALELKRAKNTWLNLLSVSTNYNDQTFAKASANTYVYPKYFFGITVPLGIIFSQGTQVKIARESVANGKDQQEMLARKIKADILQEYEQYVLYSNMIEMESELINDVLANSTQAEQSFKQGTISVEAYIAAQKAKNDEMGRSMNLQLDQDKTRIDIERMIGVPLETVLHPPHD